MKELTSACLLWSDLQDVKLRSFDVHVLTERHVPRDLQDCGCTFKILNAN